MLNAQGGLAAATAPATIVNGGNQIWTLDALAPGYVAGLSPNR